MKKNFRRILATLLVLVLALGVFPATAFAEKAQIEDEVPMDQPQNYGLINQYHYGTTAVTDAYLRGESMQLNGTEVAQPTRALPSKWDSRDQGWITSVKNQNPYGSCWAHAALASIEAYMIKNGVRVGTGSAATTSLNLSETQHCFFNYTSAYDAEGMLNGDKSAASSGCLDQGGNGEMSAYTLQRWCGAASESVSALSYSNASTVARSGLNSQYAYGSNVCHVQNSVWIPASNIDAVKQAIMDYGAGNISYYESGNGYTYTCTIDNSSQNSSSHKWANHAITLVGWDDSISSSKFSPNRPSKNGAWICKNSWGTSQFDGGYTYISFADTSVLEGSIFFYDAEPIDNYAHNYQYDGTCNVVTAGKGWNSSISACTGFANNTKVANVFTAKGTETLKAIAFCSWDEAMSYTVEIYKNPTTGNPSSGSLVSTTTGTLTFPGYYTIPLSTTVPLSANETFSVVITQNVPKADEHGYYVPTPYDSTFNNKNVISWATFTHTNHGNTSYYKEPNGNWTDCPDNGDYRIKAYTVDGASDPNPPTPTDYTVTAVSNNNAWGTVSVSGNVITAYPATGYYVAGAQVTAGTATYTISGNTITVNPTSNCTVQVNFAQQSSTNYTVTAVSNNNSWGTVSVNGYNIIATPATGYYVASAQVISGTATYSINGNVITVNPSSNCTVQVNFAQQSGGSDGGIVIDDNASGGYEGDYVVIYNPATNSSTSYSTGNMSGLIETTINAQIKPQTGKDEMNLARIDIDPMLAKMAENAQTVTPPEPLTASFNVGSTRTFTILSQYSPTGSSSVQFKCLYVGQHCYIWTPTSTASNVYPLDKIDSSFAKLAADEFDSKFSLMQSSFGTHTNGSQGDGKLSILYYNINDGWEPGKGYVGGFFYSPDISNNGLPILNIDTYPGVYYKNNSTGAERKSMDYTYNTMVHEYQHLINYSHTSNMSSWLNECFSAAAEEICYPGSSVVSRIQSWEDYYYSENNDWLNPPAEFKYNSSFNLHNGYSMYAWDNNLDDVLALYSQVSFFAQYLYTRFGNTIYQQISNKFSSGEVAAITSATGVNCADLVRDFRVAVTANASQDQYDGKYGFKVQPGYDPAKYNNVQNPWSLLKPVVFTGSSCSIKGGGAITVKPVNGVYNPPSGASSSLKYIGIKINKTNPSTQYTVSAVSNNTSWGTVSVNGNVITATPANGYYVADAQVIAGTATYSINGNVITVNPSSDCTIQVNFAAKTSVTVTYVSSGAVVGTKTVYVQESVTLPSSVNNTPSGWTFIGWTENQVEQTQNKPTYYAPGASYTVPRNITLYALYKKGQATGSVKAYELVTSAPSNWTGNYVITSGTDSNMLILKGLSGTTAHQNSSGASSLSASGATLNGTRLENVNDLYVFQISASGSSWYSSGYTLQNKSTGTYLYADSTNGFYSVEVQYSSGMTWGLAYSNGCMRISNSAVYSHPYLARIFDYDYFGMTNRYDTDYPTQLWKETEGTTEVEIYWTNPNAHTHSLQYVAAVAATCTNAGHSAYYYCSGCNKYFSDSNAQNEITLASTNIPALGHTAGTAVKENEVAATCTAAGGYDMVVYCSVCGAELSREHTAVDALGHNPGTPVEENRVEPTETADGGYDTVVYCTRCNAELSREHTVLPATGPVADANLKFKTASLTLQSDISINFYVLNSVLEGYSDPYVVFTKEIYKPNGEVTSVMEETVNVFTEKTEGSNSYRIYSFTGVYSTEMGSKVTATLYATKDGKLCKSNTVEYSVLTYANTMLSYYSNNAKMRTLLVDLLNYGASAQTFFGYNTANLVNKDLTEEQKGWATAEAPELDNHLVVDQDGNPEVRFQTASLMLKEKVSIYFYLADNVQDVSDLEARISYNGQTKTVDGADFLTKGSNKVVEANFFNSLQMRVPATIKIYRKSTGECVSGSVTYSIVTYAYQMKDDSNPDLVTLTQNMIKFGDSARAYFVG